MRAREAVAREDKELTSDGVVASVEKPGRATPSGDLNAFLVELSVALHRYSMYPSDHPSIGPSIEGVVRRASALLKDRPSIALGVARRQLIIDGVATDPNQPVLRRLAESLHGHHLGAISLLRGLQVGEMAEAMLALASEPLRDGPIGLRSGDQIPVWPHVTLHSLTFDGLALVGDVGMTDGDSKNDTLGAELWVGLARAALAVGDGDDLDPASAQPGVVARAIDDHPSAEAYDQVIIGFLLQIARELKSATGAEAKALRSKTSSLIASIKSDTLQRLVEMGGDTAQRGDFVLDATHGMAVKALLEIVQAAAKTNGQTISDGLLRMLSKLADQAEGIS